MLRGVQSVGRFAAFSSVRDGCKKRAVCFEKEGAGREPGHCVLNDCSILEGDDASEGYAKAKIDEQAGLFIISTKAVINSVQFAAVRPQDGEGVIPGISLMDDNVEMTFEGEFKLLLKEERLSGPVLGPIFERILLIRGIGMAVIVHARFTDGHHCWVSRERTQWGKNIFGRFVHVTGMDPDGSADLRVLLS